MSHTIKAIPYIDPILLNDKLTLYASGKEAIYHAVRAVDLPVGSTVLLPFVFGRTAHRDLPVESSDDSGYLARHIAGMPVHQKLNGKDITIIADIINEVVQ